MQYLYSLCLIVTPRSSRKSSNLKIIILISTNFHPNFHLKMDRQFPNNNPTILSAFFGLCVTNKTKKLLATNGHWTTRPTVNQLQCYCMFPHQLSTNYYNPTAYSQTNCQPTNNPIACSQTNCQPATMLLHVPTPTVNQLLQSYCIFPDQLSTN